MRKFFWIGCCLIYCFSVHGQIDVKPANQFPYTPVSIINDVLLKNGLDIIDVSYLGSVESIGVFNNARDYIGINNGLILSTGMAESAALINGIGYSGSQTVGDAIVDQDLENLSPADKIQDISKFEIKFIPQDDSISFRYVFASEEYPEFVCSQFNDVFGFFISGPNPKGGEYDAKNIALVPDPSSGGTSFVDLPVSINSVNGGEMGAQGSNLIYCQEPFGSLGFENYYNTTAQDDYPVYDGYLDVFTAVAEVVPCEEYVIKIAIGDGGDTDFDSAVFLEAHSFSSTQVEVEIENDGIARAISESCGKAKLNFNLSGIVKNDKSIELSIIDDVGLSDIATINEDYTTSNLNLVIPQGESSATLDLNIINDNISEGVEFIYFDYEPIACLRDTIKIAIVEDSIPAFRTRFDFESCEGEEVFNHIVYLSDYEQQLNQVFSNKNRLDLFESNNRFSSSISVNAVLPEILSEEALIKVCIDSLTHEYLNALDFYLQTPSGQVLELSTDNGNRPNNGAQVDSMIQTCFHVQGNNNINLGNPVEGDIDPSNLSYTGDYQPEGNWSDIFVNEDAKTNGQYTLLVANDETGGVGSLYEWSLHFKPKHELYFNWYLNGELYDCNNCDEVHEVLTEDTEFVLVVSDNFACSMRDTTLVKINPKPLAPTNFNCQVVSSSELRLTWDDTDLVDDYHITINGYDYFYQTGDTGTFNINGLKDDEEYIINIVSFVNNCSSDLISTTCTTLSCTDVHPVIDSIAIQNPICYNQKNGSIEVFSSNESGNLSYFLNQLNQQNSLWTNLDEGQYYLRVINEIDCGVDTIIDLIDPPKLELELVQNPIRCNGESNGRINAIASGGTGLLEYEWSNGFTSSLIDNLGPGIYSCTITDENNCTLTRTVSLQDPTGLFVEDAKISNASCTESMDGSISITMVGGVPPYIYEWDDPNKQSNKTAVNLGEGNYNLTVIDANGCFFTTQYQIEVQNELIIDYEYFAFDCESEFASVAAIINDGMEPYVYNWSNGAADSINISLSLGQSFLSVTDANGCVSVIDIDLQSTELPEFEVNSENNVCYGDSIGTIEVILESGNNQHLIEWEDGVIAAKRTQLKAGIHCFQIKEGAFCLFDSCVNITEPLPLTIDSIVQNNIDCFGMNDGSIIISVNGGNEPYKINWSNGDSLSLISNLEPGEYTVSITDNKGCINTRIFNLSTSTKIELVEEITQVNCRDTAIGKIDIELSGGNSPYEYIWSNGERTEDIENLKFGTYYLEVLDDLQCSYKDTFEILNPNSDLSFKTELGLASCDNAFDGEITVLAEGGVPPYEYQIDFEGFGTNNVFVAQNPSIHTIVVRDSLLCVYSEEILLETISVFDFNLGPDTIIAPGNQFLLIPFATDPAGFIYDWDIQGADSLSCYDCHTTSIESVSGSNIITLTVISPDGCIAQDFVTVFVENQSLELVEVPTGFSPNGDDRNDWLVVYGIDDVQINSFYIFNRWGEKVYEDFDFQTNQLNMGWDGTFNGSKAQVGTYFWSIEYVDQKGNIQVKKGNTVLID